MLMKSGSFFLEGTKNEGGVTSVYLLDEAAKNSISFRGNGVEHVVAAQAPPYLA